MIIKRFPFTDRGYLALWDAAHNRPELATAKPNIKEEIVQQDKNEARLALLHTDTNGEHDVGIYLNEQPPREVEKYYLPVKQSGFVNSLSGKLILGGIDDYCTGTSPLIGPEDPFEAVLGRYTVQLRELHPPDLYSDENVVRILGEEDATYFQVRNGPPRGCILAILYFPIAVLLSFILFVFDLTAIYPWLLLPFFLLFVFRRRIQPYDEKFESLKSKLDEYYDGIPYWLLIVTRER